MKKKLCYYLIIVLTLFSFNSVLALGTCEGLEEKDLPVLSMNVGSDSYIRSQFGAAFNRNSNFYYQMRLDGHKALCIDSGLQASPGDVYEFDHKSNIAQHNMALGFYLGSGYPGQERYKWAIAQYIAWNGLSIGPAGYTKLYQLVEGDSKLHYEILYKHGYVGGYTDDNRVRIGAAVMRILEGYRGSGPYYVWRNRTRGSAGQRVITTLAGCDEPTPEETCPMGDMQKTNVSISCNTSKGGNKFTGYQNVAIHGEKSNVSIASESRAIGEEFREIGTFCKLYCQEYGEAILPGAIGEALPLGSYMIWPTSENNHNDKFYDGYYPLKFSGTLSCKIGVIPDAGLPFACKRNPIEEYKSAYDYVTNAGNITRPTYQRTAIVNTNEKMRLKITTWGASDSMPSSGTIKSACTSAHNNRSYATDEQYVYDEAKKIRDEALREYNIASAAVNNFSGTKYEKKCKSPVGNTCPMNEYADVITSAYAAVLAEKDRKGAIYDAKQKIVDEIEASINRCVTYTTNFEKARQILKEYKTCAEFETNADLYPFSSSVSFNFTDEEYNVGDVANYASDSSMTGGEPQLGLFADNIRENGFKVESLRDSYPVPDVTSKVDTIKAREITIKKEDTYELYTGYKYVDKESKKYLTYAHDSNYSTINTANGVIPTSYNNKIAKKYYMTLSGIYFGLAGFGINDDGSSSSYVCPVQFTKVSNTTCVCPEGTKMEGMDIIGLIANNKMTCADAQLLYCDSNVDRPHEDMYCPNMPDVSIGACVNSGYTKSECINKICTRKYTCKNTNGVDGEMDITSCVQTKIMQGLTEQQAIDYCDSVVCPIGRTIIYRTIRLENPFPSYDPSQNLYNGLTTGMFNNNTKGRYPGSNWNGILTVYNKIRNNRSGRLETNESTAINKRTTIGTTIYQTKEPLYTFVLDGGTIREIRRYNESRVDGYNDFNSSKENNNMDCKINNSIACVSAFVHDPSGKYGLTGGVCKDSDGKDSFYKCARR